MWPFYLLGTFADALTSWIGTLVGLRNLWSPICHLIAISPAIIILRLVLPLWWRLISLRIVKKQPLEGELSCIN
jgi:hypothetical protein